MTIRIACVGAGYFSRFHYDSWRRIARMQDVSVVGACDSDIDKARATGLPAYTDADAMIAEQRPDVVDIILPPEAHTRTIRLAINAGVRTIICQKPFCQNLVEAEEIVALATGHGVRLIVHENFRFQPWYRTIRAALDDKAIGQVQQVTFRLRPGDGQGPHAYLDRQPYFQKMPRFLIHETGVHWIDTFRYLLGTPTAVYADLRRINPAISGEDAGYVIFDHPGGVRALFDGNRHLDHASDNRRRTMGEALIEGTAGTLSLCGDGAVRLRRFRAGRAVLLRAPDTWDGFGGDCVHALQCHVIAGLTDDAPIENEASEYLDVLRIEETVYRSATEGRKCQVT